MSEDNQFSVILALSVVSVILSFASCLRKEHTENAISDCLKIHSAEECATAFGEKK